MRKTGFLLVDGSAALGLAPAAPRHWLAALLIVIVAQWIYWQGYDLAQAIVLNLVASGLLGEASGFVSAPALLSLIYLFLPSMAVAGLALYVSRRFDNRSAKANGVDAMTPVLALVWVLAGLVAAAPLIVAVIMSAPALVDVMQGIGVLVPVTVVQAGAEEIIFRSLILAAVSARYGIKAGLLISALLFGLWHVGFGQPLFDGLVAFASTFVFGVTAGIVTLHYGNLGPALALHVVWNVVGYLHNATAEWTTDFWSAWATTLDVPWTLTAAEDGSLVKFLVVPLLIESLIVLAACRETVAQLTAARQTSPA